MCVLQSPIGPEEKPLRAKPCGWKVHSGGFPGLRSSQVFSANSGNSVAACVGEGA